MCWSGSPLEPSLRLDPGNHGLLKRSACSQTVQYVHVLNRWLILCTVHLCVPVPPRCPPVCLHQSGVALPPGLVRRRGTLRAVAPRWPRRTGQGPGPTGSAGRRLEGESQRGHPPVGPSSSHLASLKK